MHMITLTTTLATLALRAAAAPQGIAEFTPNEEGLCMTNTECGGLEYSEHDHPAPHQLYKFIQISDNTSCGKDGTCEIAKSFTKGKSVAVSAGTELTGKGFLTAGFEVTSYTEEGEIPNCQAAEGEIVCVFHRQAHTIYGVSAQEKDSCCEKKGDPFDTTITAPNEKKGNDNVCARGDQCVWNQFEYWNNMEAFNGGSTVEGGPQRWKFGSEDGLKKFDEFGNEKKD